MLPGIIAGSQAKPFVYMAMGPHMPYDGARMPTAGTHGTRLGEKAVRLAVLEDDPSCLAQLDVLLTAAGHSVHCFTTAAKITKALREESFDLLMFDWVLPDKPGIEVLKWAHDHLDPCPPMVMITSRTEQEDVVSALEAGADDYVTKPFQPEVLRARIAALLRRSYKAPSETPSQELLFGATFDHGANTVTIDGRVESLTMKEFGLAHTLFRNMHRPMSRTHLLEAVWGRNPDLPTRTLDVHVSRLRARLGLRPEKGFRLSPVHSFGYRLEVIDPVQSSAVA